MITIVCMSLTNSKYSRVDVVTEVCFAFFTRDLGVHMFDWHLIGSVEETFCLKTHMIKTFLYTEPLTGLQTQAML